MPADDDLEWTERGPRSRRFDDIYFSPQDGLAESRAVFLGGCGLPEAWSARPGFVVAELGFGSGLNVAALLNSWRRTRPKGGRLSIFSVEAFPMRREEAARALSAWPEIAAEAQWLVNGWPSAAEGFHRIDIPGMDATVDLALGDAASMVEQWSGVADAWFLDGFAPARNPQMWSDRVLDAVTSRSAPGARAATFTVAGAVRRGLEQRGWRVEKRPGYGRKRERLEARRPDDGAPIARPPPRIAIIGAGIAGAATARALQALGCLATVVEGEGAGAGASGFPAALVTPRLDAGDAALARLGAQSLQRAAALYDRTPDAVIADTVLRLASAERDGARFARVAQQPVWGPDQMRVLTPDRVAARLGEPMAHAGLEMADARVVSPAKVLESWLAPHRRIDAGISALEPGEDGQWRLCDAAGSIVLTADAVVLAGGWRGAALVSHPGGVRLAPVRGQVSWSDAAASTPAAVWGGYVAPLAGGGLLWGATHDRDDVDEAVRPQDIQRNHTAVASRLPGLAASLSSEVQARASVRAVTADRLPVCGRLRSPGLWVLSGLGSRGFALAPLLAEHLAAEMLGAPSPLPRDLACRIDPGRSGVKA